MQRCKDGKSSTITDPQSINPDPVMPGTPLSTSRPVYTGTLCASHPGPCTSMNIGRISALRAVADDPHKDAITDHRRSISEMGILQQ